MNTYGLEGKAVAKLLSLKKLAEVSKEQYLNSIRQFLTYSHQDPDTMVSGARKNPRSFERQFIAFMEVKVKEASPSTAALIRNSTKKFLDVNGVTGIKWADIDDSIPERRRYSEDRAPTTLEVRRMVDAADLRTKCLVLFLCSSGARVGTIQSLKWKDLVEVKADGKEFAKVIVYRGEKEQYYTFITPEAYRHLTEYKHYRENIGEKVTPQTPVFVTALNVEDFKPEKIRPLATDTVKLLLARLQKQLGLREVLSEGKNARRMVFKTGHGFRKFFKTRTELAGVNRLAIEMMMGHNVGAQASYNRPTEADLVKEYSKAISELTVVKESESISRESLREEIRRQGLLLVGFAEGEISKLGDLSNLTDEEIQKAVRRRQMRNLGLGTAVGSRLRE